jgi:hypothetical protein
MGDEIAVSARARASATSGTPATIGSIPHVSVFDRPPVDHEAECEVP